LPPLCGVGWWAIFILRRRSSRLSHGFSHKLENHAAAVALNYFAYNVIRIHRTLHTLPAMAAGCHRSTLEREGPCGPLGILRAAEEKDQRKGGGG
jgi:hypothetical protein